MSDDDAPQPAWDRSEAADQLASGLAAGDKDLISLGAHRLGDAVVNATIAAMSQSFQKVLAGELTRQIKLLRDDIEIRDKREYDRRVFERDRTDARFDNFGAELDAFSAQFAIGFDDVRGLRGDFTALQAGFQDFSTRFTELVGDVETLKRDAQHLRADHAEFRGKQSTFSQAQDVLVGRVSNLGEQFSTLQTFFDELRADGERRWTAATAELQELRTIILRKDVQINQMAAELTALRKELAATREQTIADEISVEERRQLADTNRWVAANKERIVLKPDSGNDR